MIEIFRREADARIYFAVKAALKNYSVIIANKSDIWAKRNELKKGIVLFKSLGKTNLKLIRDLKKSGHKIAAWDEEAFVIPKKFNFLVNLRILEENLKLIDYFFTWGKRERNYLKSRFKNHKKLFFDTGNARIDVPARSGAGSRPHPFRSGTPQAVDRPEAQPHQPLAYR